MVEFSVFSRQCPACRATESVEPIGEYVRWKRPTHKCSKCGAFLKSIPTMQALWSVPVLALMLLLLIPAITWVQSQAFHGAIKAGILGGLGALGFSVPFNVAMRGFVFRVHKNEA